MTQDKPNQPDHSSVRLRLYGNLATIEGNLLHYLVHTPCLDSRQSIFRALRAFYLPSALAAQASAAASSAHARAAIAELQYRAMQIQAEFLAVEPLSLSAFSVNPVALPGTASTEPLPETLPALETLPQEVIDQYLDDF